MEYSEHYGLNLVEGTDTVNPMTVDKPNYEKIDETMYANECASVGTATELTTGTVHALTRDKENQNVFRFRATSNYTVGDTFTVDGDVVTAQMSDGTTLADRCYIIGSDVLCALIGTQLTLFIPKKYDANNVMDGNVSVHTKLAESSTSITSINNKLGGMKYDNMGTVEAGTNETWGSIFGRLRDTVFADYAGNINIACLTCNVDGFSGAVFTPTRVYSSAQYTNFVCLRATSTGYIVYMFTSTPTSTALYKYTHTANGLTVTDLTNTVGSNIAVKWFDPNR